jgi:iron complex outermembrane receptor protein
MGMFMDRHGVALHRGFAFLLAVIFLLVASLAQAQGPSARMDFSIAPQPLSSALIEFSKQANVQVLTSGANLDNAKSPGVSGKLTPAAALNKLLEGSGLAPEFTDANTAVVKPGPAKPAAAQPTAQRQSEPQASATPQSAQLEKVTVTGSMIPRAQVEGPAPITVISARDIAARGFATTADIMTSLSQNLGALDNNSDTDGFSNGAQAVDLRGLGPNHTLILINGRRIADYPQSYGGSSNFTDISNIPASMIDRVEILTGSASAIYGSDAISGVINFIMKKKADGTTLDYRMGDSQHGGGTSQRFTLTSGWSNDKFDSVFGVEIYNQDPLWAFQRSFTASRANGDEPSPVFLRTDGEGNYIDPGAATCNALSYLDKGSVFYASRDGWAADGGPGYYCGSNKDVGYGTLQNGRRMANFYGSATYHFNDHIDFFADLQFSTSHQDTYNTPLAWQNSYALNGGSTPIPFYNEATGQVEQWQRQYFTYEENGGFNTAMIRNINNTYSLNTGIKGTFGDAWNYEAMFSHAQNELEAKWPAIVSSEAQAFFLGPSLGTDPDTGYQIFNAPISRLYTPLTPAQLQSIIHDSVDHDTSRAENYSLTVNNTSLFTLPAGDVGFAATAEFGNQYFGMKADPMSLDGELYNLHNTDAVGSRTHSGAGFEFSVPIFSQLTATAAGRYDRYEYSNNASGKFTYALGLEYRPIDSLLLRGSYSTGFRAPDLAYLYAGPSGSSSGGVDYYLCDKNGYAGDLDDCPYNDVSFNGRSIGSTTLKDETSKSVTWGFVYSPIPNFDVSADYYIIKLSNEVIYQDSDTILREEAECRLGQLDINSTLCQQVIGQVVRNPANASYQPEQITSVLVLPINASTDRTSGIDFKAHYRWDTDRIGSFDFNLGFTYVATHRIQLYPGDPVDNELSDYYYYVIPRSKANYSVTWNYGDFTTTIYGARLGGLPNYDGTQRLGPTMQYNGTLNYRLTKDVNVGLTIDNLFDSKPGRDATWSSYPYYASRWFNPMGRSLFLDLNVKFGGHGG